MSAQTQGRPGPRAARPDPADAALSALRQAALENRRCSRRVRYEFRDGVAVAAFSAGASTALALLLTLAMSAMARVG